VLSAKVEWWSGMTFYGQVVRYCLPTRAHSGVGREGGPLGRARFFFYALIQRWAVSMPRLTLNAGRVLEM